MMTVTVTVIIHDDGVILAEGKLFFVSFLYSKFLTEKKNY